jgi:hypothetical protein
MLLRKKKKKERKKSSKAPGFRIKKESENRVVKHRPAATKSKNEDNKNSCAIVLIHQQPPSPWPI